MMQIHIILITIILLFTIYNAVSIMMDSESFISKVLALIVFLIALWLMFQRDTYLPFLGKMALPGSVLKDTTFPVNSNVDISIPFNVKDGTKVVYWGAKPSKDTISNPMKAYGDFSNAGVTLVTGGKAQIRFNCPSKYTVGIGKTLNRHIHYRFVFDNGMMSPVMTKFVNC